MTSVSTDATLIHGAGHSSPKPTRRLENPSFAAHLPTDQARAGDARPGAAVPPDGAMAASAAGRHLPSPGDTALSTPLHLWPTEGGDERVFAWSLHVNGYLSEVGTGKGAGTASVPVAEPCIPTIEGQLAAMAPHDAAPAEVASDATTTPVASTFLPRLVDPFDSTAGSADAATSSGASPGAAGMQAAPFQRILLRWFERTDGRTVYVRDFRWSTSQVQSIAARLHALVQSHAGLTRVVVNGHAVSTSPSHQPQGAPACPSIP